MEGTLGTPGLPTAARSPSESPLEERVLAPGPGLAVESEPSSLMTHCDHSQFLLSTPLVPKSPTSPSRKGSQACGINLCLLSILKLRTWSWGWLCVWLCLVPLDLGLCRCLRFLATPQRMKWGSWGRCPVVRNPVHTLSEPELHPVLHADEEQTQGLTLSEG